MSEKSNYNQNDETENTRKNSRKLGILTLCLTLIGFISSYFMVCYTNASLIHHWYLNLIAILLSIVMTVVSLIMTFKGLKFIIIGSFCVSLVLIFIAYYLRTTQYVFIGIVKDRNYEEFELNREVFLIFKNESKVTENGEAMNKEEFSSVLKDDIRKNTKDKKNLFNLDITANVKNFEDAQFAIEEVIKSGLTRKVKRGVFVIRANFDEAQLKNLDFKRDDDLDQIYKNLTGKDVPTKTTTPAQK